MQNVWTFMCFCYQISIWIVPECHCGRGAICRLSPSTQWRLKRISVFYKVFYCALLDESHGVASARGDEGQWCNLSDFFRLPSKTSKDLWSAAVSTTTQAGILFCFHGRLSSTIHSLFFRSRGVSTCVRSHFWVCSFTFYRSISFSLSLWVCVGVCGCVCSRTCYMLSTKITILIAKRGHFREVGIFWQVLISLKDQLKGRTEF